MRKIAVIPARGGSKRLPRKNIIPVQGNPIISYPIAAAKESGLFDDVIVSTEDAEIEEIALKYGAKVLKRPADLAEDTATVVQVCRHVLESFDVENRPDCFCCIYATAVFLQPRDLLQSFEILTNPPEPDFVMGVSDYNLPPVQALEEKDGFLQYKWPEYEGMQSQFYPQLSASNGTLYWARTRAFLKTLSFYGHRLKGYKTPRIRAVDLDTREDLELVEIIAESLIQENTEEKK